MSIQIHVYEFICIDSEILVLYELMSVCIQIYEFTVSNLNS